MKVVSVQDCSSVYCLRDANDEVLRSTLLQNPSLLPPYYTIAGIEARFCFLSEALSRAAIIPTLIKSPIWEAENNAPIPAEINADNGTPSASDSVDVAGLAMMNARVVSPSETIQRTAITKQVMMLGNLQRAGTCGGAFMDFGCKRARSRKVTMIITLAKMIVKSRQKGERDKSTSRGACPRR